MELKDWIKRARKHAKMSGEKLGESLGRTKANVSGWEKGLHEPSFGQVVRISTITGYPLQELLADAASPAARLELPAAIELLGNLLVPMDPLARSALAPLLATLAQDPQRAEEIAGMAAVLEGATRKPRTA